MGTMLTAERPGISQRVRRRLPQSFFGRMFFSWLNPGPASGYMFVIANITSLAIVVLRRGDDVELSVERKSAAGPTPRNCII